MKTIAITGIKNKHWKQKLKVAKTKCIIFRNCLKKQVVTTELTVAMCYVDHHHENTQHTGQNGVAWQILHCVAAVQIIWQLES